MLPGQLSSARAKAGRHALQLVWRGEIVGAVVWMPSVPGAFPFRVTDPSHAAALLGLLRHLVPDAPWVQVSAEGDDALRARLVELGLYVRMELWNMRGSI
jgi:hypothetical protein